MTDVPAEFRDLLTTRCYATVATIGPNGLPHQTVTWVDYDGEHVAINAAADAQKVANVERTPVASITVLDPDDHHRYVSVAGPVVEVTESGAAEHADELGWRYGEVPEDSTFAARFGESERRIVRIRPAEVFTLDEDVSTIDE